MTLDEAYGTCKKIVKQSGSSFYYGMRLLPIAKRRSIYAVYAWSRLCDDAVDEYSGEEAIIHLAAAKKILEDARSPEFGQHDNPLVQALGDTIRRFQLSVEPFYGLLEGMHMDIEPVLYRNFDELIEYLKRVAGTVGELCVGIFGAFHPAARELAVDLGIALQLTNILRDLKEDILRGRIYLPTEELEKFGYTMEDLAAFRQSPSFHHLMAYQVERTHEYFERAQTLFSMLEKDAIRSVTMLYAVYFELLKRIEKGGFDVFTRRVRLSTTRKLWLVGESLWQQRMV